MRELELSGDKAARDKLANFDAARQRGDISASLEFERNLVRDARELFQFLSPVEATDLERLFEDRNRCAHSTMLSTDEPYTPAPELARAHIRTSIISLLRHPPVQGQAALDRIWNDIKSEYFTTDANEALAVLRDGPLGRARPSVVRSVILGLCKDLLLEQRSSNERRRQLAALQAVSAMYLSTFESTLRDKLPDIIPRVPDERLPATVRFVAFIPVAWEACGVAAQLRVRKFVATCPPEVLCTILPHALRIDSVDDSAVQRFDELDSSQIIVAMQHYDRLGWDVNQALVPRSVVLLESVGGFRAAEMLLRDAIIPVAHTLTATQLEQILIAFHKNDQVAYAKGAAKLVSEILRKSSHLSDVTRDMWSRFYEELRSHPYYTDGHGSELKAELERTFGFTGALESSTPTESDVDFDFPF